MKLSTLSDLVFHIRELSSGRSDLLSFDAPGRRENLSTADFLRGIHSVTLALEARGVGRGDRVAILSENRPEWHIVDFACQLLGAPSVPLDPGLSRQQVGFILRNSASRWVFYSGIEHRDMLLSLASTLTSLPELVAFESDAVVEGRASITRLMGEGASRLGDIPIERFRDRVNELDPASLIYTMPSAAPEESQADPRAKLLNHQDMVTSIAELGATIEVSPSDRVVSSQSLAHSLPRSLDHLCFYRGATIHHTSGEVPSAVQREHPTHLIAAPDLYSEIYRSALKDVRSDRLWRRRFFHWAIDVGRRHGAASRAGFVGPLASIQRRLASALVYRRFRRRFGDQIRQLISDGAVLDEAAVGFYAAVGLPVHQTVSQRSDRDLDEVSSETELGRLGPRQG